MVAFVSPCYFDVWYVQVCVSSYGLALIPLSPPRAPFLLVCSYFCLCACVIAFVWLFILSNCFIVCVCLFRNGIIGLVGDGVLFEIMLDDDVSGGGAFLVRCSTTP